MSKVEVNFLLRINSTAPHHKLPINRTAAVIYLKHNSSEFSVVIPSSIIWFSFARDCATVLLCLQRPYILFHSSTSGTGVEAARCALSVKAEKKMRRH